MLVCCKYIICLYISRINGISMYRHQVFPNLNSGFPPIIFICFYQFAKTGNRLFYKNF